MPSKSDLGHYKSLDKEIFKLNSKLPIFKYITPINAEDERKRFFQKFSTRNPYNPKFIYPKMDIDLSTIYSILEKLQVDKSSLGSLFWKKVEELKTRVSLLENLTARGITRYSSILYGKPSKGLFNRAKNLFNNTSIPEEIKYEVKPGALKQRMEDALKRYRLNNWKVKIRKNMNPRVNVNVIDRRVEINGNYLYHEEEARGLEVHEVSTHILRVENGSHQPFAIFEIGLAHHEETEEGLAAWNEERVLHLREDLMLLYAGRVLACSLSLKKSFWGVFSYLVSRVSPYRAYYITQRIKRGFKDTSQPGAFTKDYVYMSGLEKIKRFLKVNNRSRLELLYMGKFGLDDLKQVKILRDKGVLSKPKILPWT